MTEFRNVKTSARVVNGRIDMLTVRIPFGLLPDKAKFRYGYEQDDITFTKTKTFDEKPDKIVLIDFLSYAPYRQNRSGFKNVGIFTQCCD